VEGPGNIRVHVSGSRCEHRMATVPSFALTTSH
jgi:hypothetical protein